MSALPEATRAAPAADRPAGEARRGSALARAAARVPRTIVLIGSLALSGYGLSRLLENRVPLEVVLGARWRSIAAALLLALAIELVALARVLLGRGATPSVFADLRRLLVSAVLVWAAILAWVQPYERLWEDFALGVGAASFAAALCLEGAAARIPARTRRAVDLVLFTLCATALLGELGLRQLAVRRPSQIFARTSMEPSQSLASYRLKPGQVHFGFASNAAGHYDDPFARRRAGERRVAVIGDSFSLGVVPHTYHYTTVCERALGHPVDNFGAPGIGLNEYEQLLLEDVLPTDPSLVVVAVFVGNDLTVTPRLPEEERRVRSWLDREQVLLCVVPRRLARISAEAKLQAGKGGAGSVQGSDLGGALIPEGELVRYFPWIEDPSLEKQTFSPRAYLPIETARAREGCASLAWQPDFERACLDMIEEARPRPVAFLLIPDEFQVEDELWGEVVAEAGAPLERDRPQQVITAWMAERGIPCLDLLPALRAVEPLADGRRHLYQLRDTHWNARGNRVGGEALAGFLARLLP